MAHRGTLTKKIMVEIEVTVDYMSEVILGDGYHEPTSGGINILSVMMTDKNGKAVDVEHLLHEDDISEIVEDAHVQVSNDSYFGDDRLSDED